MRVENSENLIVQVSLTGKTKSASKKVVRNIEVELIRGKARGGGGGGMKRKYGMTTNGKQVA